MVEKYIKDGKVAVLVANGYGGGWSSQYFDYAEDLMFNKEYVEMVLQGKFKELGELVEEKYDMWLDSVEDLIVQWVAVGTLFRINEYDGKESLEIYNPDSYFAA